MSSGPGLLLVMTEFPPSFGGMQTHAIYLARALVERGYRVQVVTQRSVRTQVRLQARQLDRELPFPVLRILSRIGHYHNLALIEQAARAWRAQLIYCSTVFYGELAERLGLPLLCRSVGNDVLRPWIGYPFRPLSRLMSQRHVERLAHLVHRGLERGDALELLFQQRRREVMIDSARRHTTIFANSQFTAEALREIGVGRERIEIVVGGVDAQRFGDETAERTALQIPQGRFIMLTACRLVRKKGVDFLIESMCRLVSRIPDLHLVIVGAGRCERRFARMARSSPVKDRISFAGPVQHAEIERYYRVADLFVLASRVQVDPVTGLRDAETMGRVLCEANAAGIPVVAARSGGIPSVVESGVNGLLFEPDDANDLADKIELLRSSPGMAASLVASGRRLARDVFDWSVVVAQHEQRFRSLIGA